LRLKKFDLYTFVFNKINIKKNDNVMDEDLNAKIEVKGSNPCVLQVMIHRLPSLGYVG
jgi:hypothetical protein